MAVWNRQPGRDGRPQRPAATARQQRRPARPAVEALEGRALLAAGLDPTFGAGGIVVGPVDAGSGPTLSQITAEAVQADGKIVVVGEYYTSQNPRTTEQVAVRRFNADGSVDTTFGTNGQTTIPLPASAPSVTFGLGNGPRNLVIKADGSIILATGFEGANTTQGIPQGSLVAQLTPTGQLDATFGTNGEFVLPGSNEVVSAVAVNPVDGTILAAGAKNRAATSTVDDDQLLVIRLTAAGALDTRFGGTGEVVLTTPTTNSSNRVSLTSPVVALTPTGQIELASSSHPPALLTGYSGVLARLNATGTPDTTYGPGGILAISGPLGQIDDMTIQPDGKVVVVGSSSSGGNIAGAPYLVRLRTDGTADPTFQGIPAGGDLATPAGMFSSVVVGSDGLITTAGSRTSATNSGVELFVEQFTAAGQVNTQFAATGQIRIQADPNRNEFGGSLALTGSGKILVGGTTYSNTTSPSGDSVSAYQSVLAQIAPGSTGTTTPTPTMPLVADLVVSAVAPATTSVGAALLFTTTVANVGNSNAANVIVAVDLSAIPAGSFYAILSRATTGDSGDLNPMPGHPGMYLIGLGPIGGGASAVVDVVVIPHSAGVFRVGVAASNGVDPTGDPTPGNNLAYVGATTTPVIVTGTVSASNVVLLNFGAALAQTAATDTTRYHLTTSSGTTVPIRSARYNAVLHQVTLRLARPIPAGTSSVQLTVTGLGTADKSATTTLVLQRKRRNL